VFYLKVRLQGHTRHTFFSKYYTGFQNRSVNAVSVDVLLQVRCATVGSPIQDVPVYFEIEFTDRATRIETT
jgi:hypothetical protein